MKRIPVFRVGSLLALMLLLAGCSEPSAADPPAAVPPQSQAEPDEPTTPVVPSEPAAPVEPTKPTGEAAPTEPSEPATPSDEATAPTEAPAPAPDPDASAALQLQIGDTIFTATLADNAAVQALAGMLTDAPIVIEMQDYGGFEKVGSLGTSLPANDSQTTTEPGDIVLYQGDQIVIFYGSNTWGYTRLGRVDDLTGWAEALGGGDITVTLSLAEPASTES